MLDASKPYPRATRDYQISSVKSYCYTSSVRRMQADELEEDQPKNTFIYIEKRYLEAISEEVDIYVVTKFRGCAIGLTSIESKNTAP